MKEEEKEASWTHLEEEHLLLLHALDTIRQWRERRVEALHAKMKEVGGSFENPSQREREVVDERRRGREGGMNWRGGRPLLFHALL